MKNDDKKYRMIYDDEPTEEQLSSLMHEVAVDAQKKGKIAELELMKNLRLQISEAFKRENVLIK